MHAYTGPLHVIFLTFLFHADSICILVTYTYIHIQGYSMSFEADQSSSHATGVHDSAPISGVRSASASVLQPSRSATVRVDDDDEDSIIDEVHYTLPFVFMPLCWASEMAHIHVLNAHIALNSIIDEVHPPTDHCRLVMPLWW
jgi:hypothetical protein